VLAAALGGLGAVVVSRFATPDSVKAVDGDAVLVGIARTGATETSITVTGAANAIAGVSDTGTGLRGSSTSIAPVVDPTAAGNATGVIGTAGATTNIAVNTGETGVYGYSDTSPGSNGIWGDSVTGTGVYGSGDTGVYGFGYYGVYSSGRVGITGDAANDATGVHGFSGTTSAPDPAGGIGVQATAGPGAVIALNASVTTATQIALNVTGKTKFSRSGRATVRAGTSSKKVLMAGVSGSSYIIATLQSKRSGIHVAYVVPAAGYFTIYLNKAGTSSAVVGFLVIN
jgi:hypothetical protein